MATTPALDAQTTKPFIRYARVSRVGGREGEGYISIPEQQRTMDALAREHGVDVLPELFIDEDASGGSLDRPKFQEAITLACTGRAGGIIVATFDRFSRDTEDALATLRELEQAGGRLLCGDGNVTLANGSDTFIATVRAAVSAFERARRGEYLDKSVRNAIERGVHLSAPFGYRKSNGKGTKLTPVPGEAAQVLRAFELRAKGHSWPAVAERLNASGAPPRPRKRHGIVKQARWTHKTARQMVANEVYLGTAYNGSRRRVGAHAAIVTPELYARANRTKGTKPVGPSEGYLLSGLVRCSGCGYAMTHAVEHGKRYYRCRAGQHGDGRCPAPATVPAAALEDFVAERFADEYLGTTWIAEAADEAMTAALAAVDRGKARLKATLALKLELGEQPTALELEVVAEQVDEARDELRQAEAALTDARRHTRGVDLPPQLDTELFAKVCADDVAEARHWISLVYRCVIVRRPRAWRQPAAERARLVSVDDAPSDTTRLIGWVTEHAR